MELAWENDVAWPDCVAQAVLDNGPALTVATSDERLGAFVLGRLAGLRETLRHDGTRLKDWKAAFWNTFLSMACRHAAADAVALALRHGADPAANDGAAATAAATGSGLDNNISGPTIADYRRVMQQLLDSTPARAAVLAVALPTAAADEITMLDFLLAQGADLRVNGPARLAAAARHLAFDAFAYLLERGADLEDAVGLEILVAAVASLDEAMVSQVLAAGADPHSGTGAALRAAFNAQPWDLYGGEPDFIHARADIIALLLRHGAYCADAGLVEAIKGAWHGCRAIEALLERQDLDADSLAFIASLAPQAFGHVRTPSEEDRAS